MSATHWRIRWRVKWHDGHVSWYQNDGYLADTKPTEWRARSIAKQQSPTAGSVAYVTVRRHVGVPRYAGATYAVPAPKGAKR